MSLRLQAVILFLSLVGYSGLRAQPAPPQKYALLIGIDTYQPAGTRITRPAGADAKGRFVAGLEFANLKGPENDIAQIRALLTSAKFGFPNDDQHIHTLMDEKATRQGILNAMNTYVAGAKPGDTVVLYISSHGSLRVNDAGNGQLYELDDHPHKLDSTIVPADAYLGTEDISSRELRDVLLKAATRGVDVTAIIDACHSGGQARGVMDGMVKRSLSWDPRDLNQPAPQNADGTPAKGPEDLDQHPALVLSASQKDQPAFESQSSDPPHGLFTNALVHALEALPAGAKASDVFRRVLVDMEVDGAGNQQPALDGTAKRKAQPLFGGQTENGPLRATVVAVNGLGVTLDIGKLADIGVGSEFVETVNGQEALLRVKDYLHMDRSLAQQISGPQVKVKDVVTRKTWVPAPQPKFYLYPGPTNLSLAEVRTALAVVRNANLALVNDPAADRWTHIVFWDGTNWAVQAHGSATAASPAGRPPVVLLGRVLTRAALTRCLPSNAVVWFDAPLAAELGQMPVLNDEHSAARLTRDRGQAAYVAVGSVSESGLRYAWYDRGGFDADVQTPKGFGAGCSPASAYPLRTNWVAVDGNDPMAEMSLAGQRLAKLNGWLTLQTAATDANPFGYALGLQRVADKKLAPDGGLTYNEERYSLVLLSANGYAGVPRWVYVLGLDCQGSGQLLWPREGPGGKFPTQNGRMEQIPLPGTTIQIAPPFGTDTYILLTTASQLPDPDVLNFDGVVRSGSRGLTNPLEDLLRSTSEGQRGAVVPTPTDWGIQMEQTHSLPGGAPL